jgi:DNA adenine methylase
MKMEKRDMLAGARMHARPIVKWAGGKSKLLTELLPRVPSEIRTYAEPFAGGAALFFALASDSERRLGRAVLCDQNEELVACYRAVKADPAAVIGALEVYRYDEDLFYEVRERSTARMTDTQRAARFIYLNKTCFNGLWRVNSKGKFNVPFGRYDNPRIIDAKGLVAASKALALADLRVGDFAAATRGLGGGDFVYFDPPYDPASETSDFTAYARGGFSQTDQERLADEMRRLRGDGVFVMLSNADTRKLRDLYIDFTVHSMKAPRSINSVAERRGMARELLVTSWEPAKGKRK